MFASCCVFWNNFSKLAKACVQILPWKEWHQASIPVQLMCDLAHGTKQKNRNLIGCLWLMTFLKFACELYDPPHKVPLVSLLCASEDSTPLHPSKFLCISFLLCQLKIGYFILNLKATFCTLLEELMQHTFIIATPRKKYTQVTYILGLLP